MTGGKWGKSGFHGVVVELYPLKTPISDIWQIEIKPEYHYDLDLWFKLTPDRVLPEYSVPESIIEPRNQ